jgi:hypothetical protein
MTCWLMKQKQKIPLNSDLKQISLQAWEFK